MVKGEAVLTFNEEKKHPKIILIAKHRVAALDLFILILIKTMD